MNVRHFIAVVSVFAAANLLAPNRLAGVVAGALLGVAVTVIFPRGADTEGTPGE